MSGHVVTFFEGHYHWGLAALANSLHARGFRQVIWAGYRGELPPWAAGAVKGDGWYEFRMGDDLPYIRFVPLDTKDHFTNHKPAFMEQLWKNQCPEAQALFYIDPDIVVRCAWDFFEEWAAYGVALCEDVNSPVPASHPKRQFWRRLMTKHGFKVHDAPDTYVNGGFVGVTTQHAGFVAYWRSALELVRGEVSSLETLAVKQESQTAQPLYPFDKTDQDALNMALMLYDGPVSMMGQEAMDFKIGGWTMSHALGARKPWSRNYLRDALGGIPPSPADKAYWMHVESPIRLYSPTMVKWKKMEVTIAAAVGRFYRRGGL